MRIARWVSPILFLACLGSLRAQQAGMQNEWDIHKTLIAIAEHAEDRADGERGSDHEPRL